jgi:hypothetical protein
MAAARDHKQMVELVQQILRPSAFLNQAGSFGVLDPALNGIFIEAREHLLYVWPQIKSVEKEFGAREEANPLSQLAENPVDRTNFHISPVLLLAGSLQIAEQEIQLFG